MPFRQAVPLRSGCARDDGGIAPSDLILDVTAGQSHRLTSGGIAATKLVGLRALYHSFKHLSYITCPRSVHFATIQFP